MPKILFAGIILWTGFKVVKKVVQLLGLAFEKASLSETLIPFKKSTTGIILMEAVLFVIAKVLAADFSVLVAILAVICFAIGMALQGILVILLLVF